MAEFKINISDNKTGKTIKRELKEENANFFLNKKIGDEIKGESIDLTGYKFKITGGSDKSGFPMRRDVEGTSRKKILITGGIGFHNKRGNGMRRKKTVAGSIISNQTSQINLMITKMGTENLFEEKAAEPAEGKEE